MRVLGIDPGTAITGYAVVEEQGADLRLLVVGALQTPADDDLSQRLQAIYRGLRQVIAEYQPEAAGVESLFFSKNVRTAMAVGHARGVILLAIADAGLRLSEYTPLEVKQAITGYGSADKRQVQEMVKMLLHLSTIPKPDDAADAAAIAVCTLHRSKMDGLLNRAR